MGVLKCQGMPGSAEQYPVKLGVPGGSWDFAKDYQGVLSGFLECQRVLISVRECSDLECQGASWSAKKCKGVPESAEEYQRVQTVSCKFKECNGVLRSVRVQAVSLKSGSAMECAKKC